MLFPTVEYAVFFLMVLAASWALAKRLTAHKVFLLAASYLFYGFWSWRYVPLLVAVSLFAGLVAQQIQKSEDARTRKRWLVSGVTVCLAVLVYYKYTSFLLLSALGMWGVVGRTPHWSVPAPFLPLGVSFFVFHAISLMGDVYKKRLQERLRMLDALLYVAFFPQLIAGPILRASKFIPQLMLRRDARRVRVDRGMMLIVAGLFKKVILSNTLSTRLVEPVFAAPEMFHRGDVLLAIYGYAAQIYCDFSGYTDIAIGCALLLGYHFPRNFNAPYTATDPQDFWQRWHISLSSWLRDYLYIPLGGSRGGAGRTYVNLMITMLLGGLWHGASWTFVVWGGLQGLYLVGHRLWSGWWERKGRRSVDVHAAREAELYVEREPQRGWRESLLWMWCSRLLMFHAVCVGWVFFRAPTFGLAAMVFRQLGSRGVMTMATWPVVVTLVWGLAGQYVPRGTRAWFEGVVARWPAVVKGAALAAAVFVIEVLGPTGVAPFIYFQF